MGWHEIKKKTENPVKLIFDFKRTEMVCPAHTRPTVPKRMKKKCTKIMVFDEVIYIPLIWSKIFIRFRVGEKEKKTDKQRLLPSAQFRDGKLISVHFRVRKKCIYKNCTRITHILNYFKWILHMVCSTTMVFYFFFFFCSWTYCRGCVRVIKYVFQPTQC